MGKALELLYSGRRISADEALRLGLIQQVAPEGTAILDFAKKLAEDMTIKSAPLALAAIKSVARVRTRDLFARVCEAETKAFGNIFTSADAREGINAFLEKRPAKFSGR
jgi:enoyl-CoA hydratase